PWTIRVTLDGHADGVKPGKKPRAGEPEMPTASGVVKAVDAAANTLTIVNKLGESSFTVAKDAIIVIDGKPGQFADVPVQAHVDGKLAKLADLPVDAHVTAHLSVDQKTARTIQAEGPQVTGIVKSVDAAANTVSLADKRGEHTITLAKDSSVLLDDNQPGKLD